MDFYNKGGGAGMGIEVPHQTLPDAALNLTQEEIQDVISFMEALTDIADFQQLPSKLPSFDNHPEWNDRTIYSTR